MFAQELIKIPLEKAYPENDKNLALFLDKDAVLVLTSIQNDIGEYFSIKDIMTSTEGKVIFGEQDFMERIKDFLGILETRLERFFDTEKASYIFFDKEEQLFIQDIFKKNNLNCIVELRLRKEGKFESVDFEKITPSEFSKFRKHLRKHKIKYVINPERYFELKLAKINKADDFREKFEARKAEVEKQQIAQYFEKYPELEGVNSEEDFKKLLKQYAKKYHPDINPEAGDMFTQITVDFEAPEIENTMFSYRDSS
jgi:hypothetical protein